MGRYHCFTNIDTYQFENWPDDFVYPPRIGERVQSEQGRRLHIVSITHGKRKNWETNRLELMVEIELHNEAA